MQTFYKFKHYDINVGKNSSSGGAFTMISDRILESGGVVYGCVLNEKFNAIHIRAERKEQRDKMRGSKYIQSNISEAFQQIAVDLANKRKVLFSGTPCQLQPWHHLRGQNRKLRRRQPKSSPRGAGTDGGRAEKSD